MDTMRERFTAVLSELLDTDPRIAVVLAVIGSGDLADTGASARHPARVIDVGIREQAMIGVGAGFALEGFRPVMHSYAPFLVERPYEQIKLDFGHQGLSGVFVSVGASHDWAPGGRTHQAPADVSLLAALPGWEIAVPGHPDEVEEILRRAAVADHNVYLRLSSQQNREPVSSRGLTVVRRGNSQRPSVVAVGPMLDPTMEAVHDLDLTVAYTPIVKPWDEDGLRDLAGPAGMILVEPTLAGSSTRLVAAALVDRPTRILGLGVGEDELRRYGTAAEHDAAHGLDPAGLRRSITEFVTVAKS